MTKLTIIFLFISSISYSQVFEKKEAIYPKIIYNINSKDSATYLFTKTGIYILDNRSHPGLRFRSKKSEFIGNPDMITAAAKNKMVAIQQDTLYYFDITNKFNPVLKGKWKLPISYSKVYPFDNDFVLQLDNRVDLFSVNEDTLKKLTNCPYCNSSASVSYPYFAVPNGYNIEIYKYSQSGVVYLLTTLYFDHLRFVFANNDILCVYTEEYYPPPSLPWTKLSFLDLTISGFPEFYSDSNPNYAMGYVLYISALTRFYWGCGTGLSGRSVSRYVNVNPLYTTFPARFSYHLDRHLVYGYSGYSPDSLYMDKTLIGNFNALFKYHTIPESDYLFLWASNIYNAYRNDDFNNIRNTFSGFLYSTPVIRKSYLLVKNSGTYMKYIPVGDSLTKVSEFLLQGDFHSVFDCNEFVVTRNSNSFSVYYKVNNTTQKLIDNSQYKKVTDAEAVSNNLYLLDSANAIINYSYNEQQLSQNWILESKSKKSFGFAVKNSSLLVLDDKTLYLVDLANSNTSPLIIDSLTFQSANINFSLEKHKDCFFVKGSGGTNSGLRRIDIINNRISVAYELGFDFNSEFNFVEQNKKLLVFSDENAYWYKDTTTISGIEDKSNPLFFSYELSQNYPNPFNNSTIIKYSVAGYEEVTIKVFDLLGNEIALLVNEYKSPGVYEVRFETSRLSSGIYFYSIKSGNFSKTKKIVLVK